MTILTPSNGMLPPPGQGLPPGGVPPTSCPPSPPVCSLTQQPVTQSPVAQQPVPNSSEQQALAQIDQIFQSPTAVQQPALAPAQMVQQVPMQQFPMQQVPLQQMPVQQMPAQQLPIQSVQQVPVQMIPVQQLPMQQVPLPAQPAASTSMCQAGGAIQTGYACCKSSATPATKKAETDPSKMTAKEYAVWVKTQSPEVQKNAQVFFDYVSTHTPEENKKLIAFLDAQKPKEKAKPKPKPAEEAPTSPAIKLDNGYVFPAEVKGTTLGNPYQGTHRLGNWQSDNAVDIGVPEGTPIYAVTDGFIDKTGGNHDDPGSRYNGFKVTLSSDDSDFWYAHLSKLTVSDGQEVKKGDLIGYSGLANGVSHLHFGQEIGDPRDTLELR